MSNKYSKIGINLDDSITIRDMQLLEEIRNNGDGSEISNNGHTHIAQENIKPQLETMIGPEVQDEDITPILNILLFEFSNDDIDHVVEKHNIFSWISSIYGIIPELFEQTLRTRAQDTSNNNTNTMYYIVTGNASPASMQRFSQQVQTKNIDVQVSGKTIDAKIYKLDQPLYAIMDKNITNITPYSVYDPRDPVTDNMDEAMRTINMKNIKHMVQNATLKNRHQTSILEFDIFSPIDDRFYTYALEDKNIYDHKAWDSILHNVCGLKLQDIDDDEKKKFKNEILMIVDRAEKDTDLQSDDMEVVMAAIDDYTKNSLNFQWSTSTNTNKSKDVLQSTIIYNPQVDPNHMTIPVCIIKDVVNHNPDTTLPMCRKEIRIGKTITLGSGKNMTKAWKVLSEPFLSWKHWHDQNSQTPGNQTNTTTTF